VDATLSIPARGAATLPRAVLRAAGWAIPAALTALLIVNSLPYFGARADEAPFLLEKGGLVAQPLWRATFVVHVAGGILCLAAALPLFSKRLLRAAPALHRTLGWTYVTAVLVGVVPTGLFLSATAKGGIPGAAGFVVTGVALGFTTARGLREVLRGDFVAHRAWMVRSYGMAATALVFRVVHLPLEAVALPHAYETSVWASFAICALASEAWVVRSLVPHRRSP
jgi:hypothetical protein